MRERTGARRRSRGERKFEKLFFFCWTVSINKFVGRWGKGKKKPFGAGRDSDALTKEKEKSWLLS
jgi:hypothetical protein